MVIETKSLIAVGGNNRQYSIMIFSATEIYEFIAALALFLIALYFYKMKLGNIIGKDIKHLIQPDRNQNMAADSLAAS